MATNKKASDMMKARWRDPEYRERMTEQAKHRAAERVQRSAAVNVTGAKPDPVRKRKANEAREQTPEQAALSDMKRKAILVRWADRQAPPTNAAEVIAQASEYGCTHAEISKALGVGREKFKEWLNSTEHGPALRTAMAEGKAVEHDRLVGLLMEAAITGKAKGSLVAILFLLKTRHAYQEGQALVQNSVSINYQLPAPMSAEDYMRTVAPGAGVSQLVPAKEVRKLIEPTDGSVPRA